MSPSWRYRRRGPTDPNLFGTASSFPTELGPRIGDGEIRGYYFDFRFKAEEPRWPPDSLGPVQRQFHVETAQWGLGAYERYLAGDGDPWLAAAERCAGHLLATLETGGALDGALMHHVEMPHTYELRPPWISAMAQGEAASLFVRLHASTGDERYAEGARRALGPATVPIHEGGASALLGGLPFPEEYPTLPSSFVLNGGIFAIWGFHDVAVGLNDTKVAGEFELRVEALVRGIERWDTGSWSLYDLFPHPVPNIASAAYHHLHVAQLRGMSRIAARPEFEQVADRWADYAKQRRKVATSFTRKVGFRLAVPRTRSLAHRLPWSHSRKTRPRGSGLAGPVVLAYHAVSDTWPSPLAVTREQLRDQLERLVRKGYRGVTFRQVVEGDADAKSVAVTFDDGCRSVLDLGLPVLAELGIPGSVFVPTDFVGSPEPMSWPGIAQWTETPHRDELLCLSWEQLRELEDAGWEVGSHTCSHPLLTEVGDARLAAELSNSRERLTAELDSGCATLAYPYGDFDARVAEAAETAGYTAAATMVPGMPSPFAWPRIGVYSIDRPWRFRLKVSPLMRRVRATQLGSGVESAVRTIGLSGVEDIYPMHLP